MAQKGQSPLGLFAKWPKGDCPFCVTFFRCKVLDNPLIFLLFA